MSKAEIKRQIKEAQNHFATQSAEIIEELADKLADHLLGSKLPVDITDKDSPDAAPIVPADRKITKSDAEASGPAPRHYTMPVGPAKDQIDEVVKSFRLRIRDIATRRDEVIERLETGRWP